jgi:hypothetical protein
VRRPEVDARTRIPACREDIIKSSAFPVERSRPDVQPPHATGHPNGSTTPGPVH